ncbi:MAG: hypothetical protein JWR37_355 [Mycobacterium sp.]|jgi:hypothetical protein|nr:hypothetical protein [Mycobacterium sp.]
MPSACALVAEVARASETQCRALQRWRRQLGATTKVAGPPSPTEVERSLSAFLLAQIANAFRASAGVLDLQVLKLDPEWPAVPWIT